ncbi:MAG: DUF1003 domain-containing protein, partial [Anaerolineaceae bacterium]
IIMMSQNRQSQKDRLRADLDYEVNLKNELALTEIRNLLHEQLHKIRESKERMLDTSCSGLISSLPPLCSRVGGRCSSARCVHA